MGMIAAGKIAAIASLGLAAFFIANSFESRTTCF